MFFSIANLGTIDATLTDFVDSEKIIRDTLIGRNPDETDRKNLCFLLSEFLFLIIAA